MDYEMLLNEVKYNEQGLVAVVAQDYHSKKVRMVAYMNEASLKLTLETGKVHYYSRSRQEIWLKGETSGNIQYLKGISIDCDGDALLLQIEQVNGISCHTGNSSCFYREVGVSDIPAAMHQHSETDMANMLGHLYEVSKHRKKFPKEGSYTNYLFDKGIDKILKKVGEEATEVIIAAKDANKGELTFEVADLLYHLTVLLVQSDVSWNDVATELAKRK
ncbi:MAG: bifunctional phosphoribosyl-AMP cyclohydrolase/phosphoribosyl-ATP diphosphatase HisIE [Cellulosilyticaceae bacterium]